MMNASEDGYIVLFYPTALEALGDAVKPYLNEGPPEPHVLCQQINTSGALIEMSLSVHTPDGRKAEVELMVPGSMVRMIVSARRDGVFGFGPRPVEPVSAESVKADRGK